jgi:hypothetical protein
LGLRVVNGGWLRSGKQGGEPGILASVQLLQGSFGRCPDLVAEALQDRVETLLEITALQQILNGEGCLMRGVVRHHCLLS